MRLPFLPERRPHSAGFAVYLHPLPRWPDRGLAPNCRFCSLATRIPSMRMRSGRKRRASRPVCGEQFRCNQRRVMKYAVHGPFTITRKKANGLIASRRSDRDQKMFWERVRETDQKLPSACGCYVFALRAGRGSTPWYVGLASKQDFEHECFGSHQVNIYNESIAKKKRPGQTGC